MRDMIAMRARGMTLGEIGQRKNMHPAKVHRLLSAHDDNPGKVTLWEISSALELKAFWEARGEVHVHRTVYRRDRYRWFAVHKRTAKCGTQECVRVRVC